MKCKLFPEINKEDEVLLQTIHKGFKECKVYCPYYPCQTLFGIIDWKKRKGN